NLHCVASIALLRLLVDSQLARQIIPLSSPVPLIGRFKAPTIRHGWAGPWPESVRQACHESCSFYTIAFEAVMSTDAPTAPNQIEVLESMQSFVGENLLLLP